MDLLEQFQTLKPAPLSAEFAAVPRAARFNDFLAKDVDGAPVFLLADSSTATYTPGTTLRYLSVHFHVTCRVQSIGETVEGQFAVIACDSSVPELYGLFIRCVSAAAEQLPENATTQDIEACVRSLLSLFSAMNAPGRREIAGLWGELFLVAVSADIPAAVTAWHADSFERFDFSWPGGVLEVKATQGAIRSHEFALEQLDAPDRLGLVVSLLLRPQTNGIGVMDLATQIDAALHGYSGLRQRLWSNVATALGSEFNEKLDRHFDLGFAERHAAICSMTDVPAPERPRDQRISCIRFRVDLSTVVTAVGPSALKTLNEILSGTGRY